MIPFQVPLKSVPHNVPAPSLETTGLSAKQATPVLPAVYLVSPLETLLESLEDPNADYISLHDVIEAYNTLSNRIRSQACAFLDVEPSILALAPLKEHLPQLAQILRRDIRRALVDPPSDLRRGQAMEDSPVSDGSMLDDEIQHARNLATLSHHALRFLSDIFRFPALYSLFPANDLGSFIGGLTRIALASSLPTPSAHKTYALVIWIFQTQQLPLSILEPKSSELASTLTRAVNGELGFQAGLDGLHAIYTLSKRHPTLLLLTCSTLLPSVLTHLISESPDYRLQAAYAISGFSLAKIYSLPGTMEAYQPFSSAVRSFIEVQSSGRSSTRTESRLSSLLTEAIASIDTDPTAKGPLWALAVLSALIVLSDAPLFSSPQSLKLCILSLAPVLVHKRHSIRALHPHVWKCLAWAFLRLEGEDCSWDDMKDRTFRVVKQELGGGIGVALVRALLGKSEPQSSTVRDLGNVLRALDLVKDMVVAQSGSTRRDGLLLLSRLVGAIGNPGPLKQGDQDVMNDSSVLARGLFDGTILGSTRDGLGAAVRSLDVVKIDQVRQLSEEELIHHWDSLADIWVIAVERALRDSVPISQELLHVWQSLLLVQAQLTQGDLHLTTPSTFAGRVASIVSCLLVQTQGVEAQVQHLSLVNKLWAVLKNVFAAPWLPPPAEVILAGVLKRNYNLEDERVKSAWSRLCADLISVGLPALLHIVSVRTAHNEELEVTRQLWSVLAKSWKESDNGTHWEELVSFLIIPLGAWALSEREVELWDGTLRDAMSIAGQSAVRPIAVIDHMLQRSGDEKMRALTTCPKQVSIILSYIDLADTDRLPMELLSLVDNALYAMYPPTQELLSTALQITRLLGQIIVSVPHLLLVSFLSAVQRGLCRWIEDEREVMPETEYNDTIIPVYCTALDLLRHQEPCIETLNALSAFFASAFVRIPAPALGPMAFKNFWLATYHGRSQFYSSYPEGIKTCLGGLDFAFGAGMGAGLSMDTATETQRTPVSIVPDSQPSRRGKASLRDYGADHIYDPDAVGIPGDTVGKAGGTRGSFLAPIQERDAPLPISRPAVSKPPLVVAAPQPRLVTALGQLQDYSSQKYDADARGRDCQDESQTDPCRPPRPPTSRPPSGQPDRTEQTPPSGEKRPAETDRGQSSKRRKTVDSRADGDTGTDAEILCAWPSIRPEAEAKARGTHPQKEVMSEPVTRAPSIGLPARATSQPSSSRPRIRTFDCVELPTYQEVLSLRRRDRQSASTTPERSRMDTNDRPLPSPFRTPSPDEYSSWDAGASTDELQRIRRELQQGVPDSEMEDTEAATSSSPARGGTEPLFDLDLLRSPSLGAWEKRRDRSQTVPVPLRGPRPAPLRRNQTTSARLDALQRAYAAIADDASQVPVEDLVHATRLVHRIGAALNEQMSRKLADPG